MFDLHVAATASVTTVHLHLLPGQFKKLNYKPWNKQTNKQTKKLFFSVDLSTATISISKAG